MVAIVDRWVELCQAGTPVFVTVDGVEHRTKTESLAWDACGNMLVYVVSLTDPVSVFQVRRDNE